MGVQRIVIDTYTTPEHAVRVGKVATEIARMAGCSVSESKVIEHPGQTDEQTHEVYKA